MQVTRQHVAQRLSTYLDGRLTTGGLAAWAEEVLMEEEFDSAETRDVTARLGLADVRAFGLTWDDCRRMLGRLGYSARVEVVA